MKTHQKNLLIGGAAVAVLVAGMAMGNALVSSGAAPGGAIFTTDVSGTVTNQNLYRSKGDVFLNGGPMNQNCAAAGLPNGDYVFQVTDPSSKVLLSSDDIAQRRFSVVSGVINAYLGNTHVTANGPCGGRTIGLAPFNTTPNQGGEYKVWVEPAADYSPSQQNFGFKNNNSKTDNYKVIGDEGTGGGTGGGTATIFGRTYNDQNANGTDDGELALGDLAMTLKVAGTTTVVATTVSDAGGYYSLTGIPAGTYDLCEAFPADGQSWFLTEPSTHGCARLTVAANSTTSQNFGNNSVGPQ